MEFPKRIRLGTGGEFLHDKPLQCLGWQSHEYEDGALDDKEEEE